MSDIALSTKSGQIFLKDLNNNNKMDLEDAVYDPENPKEFFSVSSDEGARLLDKAGIAVAEMEPEKLAAGVGVEDLRCYADTYKKLDPDAFQEIEKLRNNNACNLFASPGFGIKIKKEESAGDEGLAVTNNQGDQEAVSLDPDLQRLIDDFNKKYLGDSGRSLYWRDNNIELSKDRLAIIKALDDYIAGLNQQLTTQDYDLQLHALQKLNLAVEKIKPFVQKQHYSVDYVGPLASLVQIEEYFAGQIQGVDALLRIPLDPIFLDPDSPLQNRLTAFMIAEHHFNSFMSTETDIKITGEESRIKEIPIIRMVLNTDDPRLISNMIQVCESPDLEISVSLWDSWYLCKNEFLAYLERETTAQNLLAQISVLGFVQSNLANLTPDDKKSIKRILSSKKRSSFPEIQRIAAVLEANLPKRASRYIDFPPYSEGWVFESNQFWPHLSGGYAYGFSQFRPRDQAASRRAPTHSGDFSLGVGVTDFFSLSAYYQHDRILDSNPFEVNTWGGQFRATLPLAFLGITGSARVGRAKISADRHGGNGIIQLPSEGDVLIDSPHRALRWSLGLSLSMTEPFGMLDMGYLAIHDFLSIGYQYSRTDSLADLAGQDGDHLRLHGEAHQFVLNLNAGALAWGLMRSLFGV